MLSHPDIDPNRGENYGTNCPLMSAVENSQYDCTRLLLAHPKADPNIHKPFILAAKKSSAQLFALFMERKDCNILAGDANGKTVVSWLMGLYTQNKGDPLKEEEFREKIMALCKNSKFDVNTVVSSVGCSLLFLSFSFTLQINNN